MLADLIYIIIALLAIVLAVVMVSVHLRKRVAIRDIDKAADRMTHGNWDARAPTDGPAELAHLGMLINLIADGAQHQLSDSQQQRIDLNALVDALPDPILALDAQGRIILLNAPAAKLLSVSPDQAMNQKLVNAVSEESIVELYEALQKQSADGKQGTINREIRLVRQGQRSNYQGQASRTTGGRTLLVLRDISTLVGAVQMKTDFVANASHELRTPIAAIKLAFETLGTAYHDDPVQAKKCMDIIEGHLHRLEDMVSDLLDLSRVESAQLKPQVTQLRTTDLLNWLKASMGPMARQRNVELCTADTDPATPAEFTTDSHLFNLILKNVVENAIKFTQPGGKVTVTIRRLSAGSVVLDITDTGIGIAPQHLDRVFERFYQVNASRTGVAGRGTGLGLAIVKHCVLAMGGTVHVNSELGKGTTFTFEFPQSPEPNLQAAVA